MHAKLSPLLCLFAVLGSVGPAQSVAAGGKASVLADVPYETPTGTRKMDIYLPAKPERSPGVPCFIWMGKSEPGARDQSVCGDLASAGFVVAKIDFAPDRTFSDQPAVIGKCAVRFIRSSAARFGVDERRIAIGGSSLGGAHALLVGLTRDEPRFAVTNLYPGTSDQVGAVVVLSALTDFRKISGVKGWSAAEKEELRVLSPVTYVTPDAPAVLIFHGTNDKVVPEHHATDLRKLLAKHRVPSDLVLLDRVGHAYSLTATNGRPLPKDVKGICISFLRAHLAPAQ